VFFDIIKGIRSSAGETLLKAYLREHFSDPVRTSLIISFFLLGTFLRLYDLSSQSPWTDEIASWWFSQHLHGIFTRESHTPYYYGLLRFFLGGEAELSTMRLFNALISVLHLLAFFILGNRILNKRAFLIFWAFICLNPADIVYARMARQYSLVLEGTLLFYFLWRLESPRWARFIVGNFLSFLYVFAAIPQIVLALFEFWKKRSLRDLFLSLLPVMGICSYYGLRFFMIGHGRVFSNVSWNHNSWTVFLSQTATQFLGDSYPRTIVFPVSLSVAGIFLCCVLVVMVWKQEKSFWHFLLMTLTSVALIEAFSPWANFKMNRYVIYLVGILIFAFAEALGNLKERYLYPIISLPLIWILYFNPIQLYPWEVQWVQEWKDFQNSHGINQTVICATDYQKNFHSFDTSRYCWNNKFGYVVDATQPLLLFVLDAGDLPVAARYMTAMRVSQVRTFDNGIFMMRLDPN
jgi:hypothetical protein